MQEHAKDTEEDDNKIQNDCREEVMLLDSYELDREAVIKMLPAFQICGTATSS